MSSGTLAIAIRTPAGLAFEGDVSAVRAEGEDGWFGIWPRRTPLLASLPPGLAVLGREADERFVAHAGGLLHWDGRRCRLVLEEAEVSDDLAAVADHLAAAFEKRRSRASHQRGLLHDLEREALRRLIEEVGA